MCASNLMTDEGVEEGKSKVLDGWSDIGAKMVSLRFSKRTAAETRCAGWPDSPVERDICCELDDLN